MSGLADFDAQDMSGVTAALAPGKWLHTAAAIHQRMQIAAQFAGRSKAEIVEVVRRLKDKDVLDRTINDLADTADTLETYRAFLQSAGARLLVAAVEAGIAVDDEPDND